MCKNCYVNVEDLNGKILTQRKKKGIKGYSDYGYELKEADMDTETFKWKQIGFIPYDMTGFDPDK